ncbi:MAG TPA: hypothetical protein VGF17_03545 [Phytomonospora sp.]
MQETETAKDIAVITAVLGIEPRERPPVDWAAASAELGAGIPADFRALIDAVGPGRIGHDTLLLAPFAADGNYDQLDTQRERTEALATIWADEADYDDPEFISKPAVFDEPGVRPIIWGASGLGFYLWWIARDGTDPSTWGTALEQSRGGEWEFHTGNATSILRGALTGELDTFYMDSLRDDEQHYFTPA